MRNILLGSSLLVTSLSAAAVAQTLPVEKYPYVSGPVTITGCAVNENKSNSTVSGNSLRINYYANKEGRKLQSITFRVRYAQTPVTITDTGDFDYKQTVTHQFNQLGGLPWAGADPTICRVVTATFADGQVVNPPFEGDDATVAPPAPAGNAVAAPPVPDSQPALPAQPAQPAPVPPAP